LLTGLVLAAMAASPAPARATAATARAVDEALVACGTRHSLSSHDDPKRGIGCARDAIAGFFREAAARGKAARVVVDRFEATSPRTRDVPAPLENVYLVLDGDDPALKKTAILVSGHYDSMCSDIMDSACDAPGADDDASGTTVAIEAARALAGAPRRATIVLAALAGEEQGLLGGKRLLEWTKAEGLTVGGVFNNDIVGATNGSKDRRPRVLSDDDPQSPARELGLWLESTLGKRAVRLIFRKDRVSRGGDHLPFVEAGLPAVRFTEPREDYRHQHQTPRTEDGVEYGDLPKFMDFDFLAAVARTNAEAARRLANAPLPPSSVIADGAVKPDTTIVIEAPDDPLRAGFEILTRDTTEPRWTVLRRIDAAGSQVLTGVRIDDAFFAVRSVGRNGERSIAIGAKPKPRTPVGPPAK